MNCTILWDYIKKKCRTTKYDLEYCTNCYKSQEHNSKWKMQVAGKYSNNFFMKRSKTCRKHYTFGKPLQQGKGIKNTKCRIEITSRGREKVDSERVMEGASKVPAMCYFFKWEVHIQMFLILLNHACYILLYAPCLVRIILKRKRHKTEYKI